MARLGGLEPPARGLGNLCSVHLSYSRTEHQIIRSAVSCQTAEVLPAWQANQYLDTG